MRNILLRLISLLTIFNLLFYSIYPAALVLAQENYFPADEGGGEDEGGADETGGGEPESEPDSGDYSDWDSYSYDTPPAETQEPEIPQESFDFAQDQQPFDFAQDQQPTVSTQGGPFKAPGLSYILPPEQETPASEALLTEQQQQAAYYDDLLTSEEQNQLVSQAREEYQGSVSQNPMVNQDSQDNAVSAYGEAADTAASGSDEEIADQRSQADADAQSATHAMVRALENGQDIPDDMWQNWGTKLGDLSDGVVDTITSQVREAQERGEQKKAEEAVAEAERRAEQDEREYTEGLAKWKNASQEEKAQIIRDAVGIPPEVPDDQVLSYSYGPLIETGAVKVEGDLDNFTVESQPLPEDPQQIQEQNNAALEFLASVATSGFSDLYKKQQAMIDEIYGKLEDLRQKAGYEQQPTRAEVETRLITLGKNNPYFFDPELNPGIAEKLLAEKEYLESLLDFHKRSDDLIKEVQMWGAIGIVSAGPIGNLVARPAGAILNKTLGPVVARIPGLAEKLASMLPSIAQKSVTVQVGGEVRQLTMEAMKGMAKEEKEELFGQLLEQASTKWDFQEIREFLRMATKAEGLKPHHIDRVFGLELEKAYNEKIAQQFPGQLSDSLIDNIRSRSIEFQEKLAEKYGIHVDLLQDMGQIRVINSEGRSTLPFSDYVGAFASDGKYYMFTGGKKAALEGLVANPDIVAMHELGHVRAQITMGVRTQSSVYPELEPFFEGAVEYAVAKLAPTSKYSLMALGEGGKTIGRSYAHYQDIAKEVVSKLDATGVDGEKMMMEFFATGNPKPIFEKVGVEGIKELVDKVPPSRAIMLEAVGRALLVEGTIGKISSSLSKSASGEEPKDNLELPFLIESVHAQDSQSETVFLTNEDYQKILSFAVAKQYFSERNKVTSQDLHTIVSNTSRTLEPVVIETESGLILQTDGRGAVDADLNPDTYKLDIVPIPGLDISIPRVIKATPRTITIPITIKEGTGQVNYLGGIYNSNRDGINAYAQDEGTTPATVVFQAVKDKSNDPILVAGLTMVLSKVNQQKTISMLPGWNLITLTALPTQPLTASSLLGQIAKQGGYATTVSKLENGAWKSYVIRGDNSFSGEDFPIEPGQAYFVKNLKRALLAFEGQEFAQPVKVNLADGWNAVGFPKTAGDYTVSTLIDELNTQDAGADAAARWESGLWDSFVKVGESYGENFAIEPNRGYIVRLKKGVELTP